MKKKLMAGALLLAGALLVFTTSCSNASASDDDSSSDSSSTSTTTTDTTTTSAVPSDATALIDFSTMTELPDTFTAPTWSYTATLADDDTYGKVLDLSTTTTGNYCTATITLDSAVDLSGKTLYVVMKGDDDLDEPGTSDLLFVINDGDSTSCETNTIYPTDDSQYVTYSEDISNFWDVTTDSDPDLTNVTSLTLAFEMADYDMQIAAIYYK